MDKRSKILDAGVALFTILFLLGTSSLLFAQGPEQPIYVGSGILNIKWSNDSGSLVFQEPFNELIGVQTSERNTWYQFISDTKQVTRSNSWPLQPALTSGQRQSFEIAFDSFIFPSPNGRYLVYVAEPAGWTNPALFPIGLADLQTNQHRIIQEIQVNNASVFDTNYVISWSGNSLVFSIVGEGYAGKRQPFYVSNFTPNLSTLIVQSIVEGLAFGGDTIYPQMIFDISNNGSQVLLEDLRPDFTSRLFLWDVNNIAASKIIPTTTRVVEAAFNPSNEQILLFVDQGGLKRHDLNSNTTTTLDVGINPSWADGGIWISPDARKVAVYNSDPGGRDYLYVFAIGSDALALFRTDTNQANLLNTLDNNPPASAYNTYATGVPTGATGGQWVMGDWDGDGVETPGVYGTNGVFYYTNVLGPSSTWDGTWFGLNNTYSHPVAGRFNSAINHDCIGITDGGDFPPYGIAFALYFTCNFTQLNPPKTFQWLSVLLPDNQGHSGPWEFAAGNFDPTVDAVDTIACRRGNFITWTNTPPTTQSAAFPYAQYIGAPHSGTSLFVVGDWDSDGTDSFGLYYTALGRLRGRNDLDWNTGLYPLDQQLNTNIVGTTSISATTWQAR